MSIQDPTFVIQPEKTKPVTSATVLMDNGDGTAIVNFRGGIIEARIAGVKNLAIGTRCSFVQFSDSGECWVIPAYGQYPTRWPRPLKDVFPKCPNAASLIYLAKDNPKNYDYKPGIFLSPTNETSANIKCWDNIVRDLKIEFAGSPRKSSAFENGERVLCYQKSSGDWIVIGKPHEEYITLSCTFEFTQIDEGGSTTVLYYPVTWSWSGGVGGGTQDIPFSVPRDVSCPSPYVKEVPISLPSPIPFMNLDSMTIVHTTEKPGETKTHWFYLRALDIIYDAGVARFIIEFQLDPPDYPGYLELWRISAELI